MKDNIKHQVRGAFIAIPFAFGLLAAAYLLTLPFQDKEPVKAELATSQDIVSFTTEIKQVIHEEFVRRDSLLKAKSSTAGVTTKTE